MSAAGKGILCIFYAEFDNILGPKIKYQSPEGFIPEDAFDTVSDYVITKPDLCGRVVTVVQPSFYSASSVATGGEGGPERGGSPQESPLQLSSPPAAFASLEAAAAAARTPGATPGSMAGAFAVGSPPTGKAQPVASPSFPASASASSSAASRERSSVKIVSFPVNLHHEKYHRNSLLFSVGIIIGVHTDAAPYEPVLRKLGSVLYSMEVETEFLFRPEKKRKLAGILPVLLHGLNSRGEVFLPVDACNTIALKLFPLLPDPPQVQDQHVPVRVRDLDVLVGNGEDSGWDLCMQMLLPHIDGVKYVRAIAEAADVEVGLVKRSIQQLLYYGCVVLTDIFQYCNLYAISPRVLLLLRNSDLRQACLDFIRTEEEEGAAAGAEEDWGSASSHAVSKMEQQQQQSPSLLSPPPSPLPIEYVLRLYTSFGSGSRVCDVCAQADTEGAGVDDRKLIQFGVIHGFLRRVHKYPVPLPGFYQQQQGTAAVGGGAGGGAGGPLAGSGGVAGPGTSAGGGGAAAGATSAGGLSSRQMSAAAGQLSSNGQIAGSSSSAPAGKEGSASEPSSSGGSSAMAAKESFPINPSGSNAAGVASSGPVSGIQAVAAAQAGGHASATTAGDSSASSGTESKRGAAALVAGSGTAASVGTAAEELQQFSTGLSKRAADAASASSASAQASSSQLSAKALRLLDGRHNLEEICCKLGMSQAQLEEQIERHGGFAYVLK